MNDLNRYQTPYEAENFFGTSFLSPTVSNLLREIWWTLENSDNFNNLTVQFCGNNYPQKFVFNLNLNRFELPIISASIQRTVIINWVRRNITSIQDIKFQKKIWKFWKNHLHPLYIFSWNTCPSLIHKKAFSISQPSVSYT